MNARDWFLEIDGRANTSECNGFHEVKLTLEEARDIARLLQDVMLAEEKVDEILSKQNPCLYCEVLLAEKEKLICPYCEKRKEYESAHDD